MTTRTSKGKTETYYVGIDVGSVSLNCVVINPAREIVYEAPYKRHMGRVEEEIEKLLSALYRRLGQNNIEAVAFTGNHGQAMAKVAGGLFEFETISQVLGILCVEPKPRTVISMG